VVFIRGDESGAADVLADFCFRKASDLKGVAVNGDSVMINSVRNNNFSVGFCNLSYAFQLPTGERAKNIHIVPFDLDYDNNIGKVEVPFRDLETAHRSVWLGIYPETCAGILQSVHSETIRSCYTGIPELCNNRRAGISAGKRIM
jgi:phosphate transport system substrate-binding protein